MVKHKINDILTVFLVAFRKTHQTSNMEIEQADGKYLIKGLTHPYKEYLKREKAKWNPFVRAWTFNVNRFKNEDELRKLLDDIKTEKQEKEAKKKDLRVKEAKDKKAKWSIYPKEKDIKDALKNAQDEFARLAKDDPQGLGKEGYMTGRLVAKYRLEKKQKPTWNPVLWYHNPKFSKYATEVRDKYLAPTGLRCRFYDNYD